jgi:GntR family transcriptional regulator
MNDSAHPFHRLQAALAGLIAATPPGQRLPSEPQLARERAFEGQGLIRRRQGVGTFVVGPVHVIESGLEVLESIETLAKKIQLDVTLGGLQVSQMEADATYREALGVPPGTMLVQIRRVIRAEGRAVAYLIDVLPEDVLTPDDLKSGFNGSVLDLLLQRGEPSLANSRTEIRAVAAAAEVARALEIQRGDVLLNFVAFLYANTGRVIDYSQSYFLPGYFRFHVVRSVGMASKAPWITVEQERRQS